MSYPETIDKAANPITLSNLRLLEEFTETLERKGIRLLLVNFPVNPAYRNTPYADMLGPTWPIYDSLLGMVKRLESKHRNFRFYDANLGGLHDYASSDAFDDGHLSGNGAVKLTRRIDSIAQAW